MTAIAAAVLTIVSILGSRRIERKHNTKLDPISWTKLANGNEVPSRCPDAEGRCRTYEQLGVDETVTARSRL